MAHVISQVAAPVPQTIDREKVCPLLLRIFVKSNGHNHPAEFSRGTTPSNEIQIYTWKDCTLKELVTLIKDVNTDSRKKGTEFDFNIVFASRSSGKYQARSIGVLQNGSRGVDDAKTLQEAGFEVGDFIDVAIFPPVDRAGYRNGGGINRRSSFERPQRRFKSFRD
ncbi:unnamed protein product [Bursaphelenchus xylophilus]|uniref:18 kDa Sin3-associated polypeptide n=1 Tax=Bursaphelenchus xylophilus TaxID=6326 RepID=A0A1I7RNG7_BURXY|nr:unnamed protein product [Bursaphelenchus xylophilus]CAG9123997.1 unnamed protein product [Bursaphelenchus xylophilus]